MNPAEEPEEEPTEEVTEETTEAPTEEATEAERALPETVEVEPETVPLAGVAETAPATQSFPWWILLVVAAVAAIGYYVSKRKKNA